LRMQFLQIAADGDRFRDHRAVVEFERRNDLERVDGVVIFAALFELGEIDGHERQFEPLLGQKHAHPARIRGEGRMVEPHRVPPWPPSASVAARLAAGGKNISAWGSWRKLRRSLAVWRRRRLSAFPR